MFQCSNPCESPATLPPPTGGMTNFVWISVIVERSAESNSGGCSRLEIKRPLPTGNNPLTKLRYFEMDLVFRKPSLPSLHCTAVSVPEKLPVSPGWRPTTMRSSDTKATVAPTALPGRPLKLKSAIAMGSTAWLTRLQHQSDAARTAIELALFNDRGIGVRYIACHTTRVPLCPEVMAQSAITRTSIRLSCARMLCGLRLARAIAKSRNSDWARVYSPE